jgi:hypothetical protein
MTPTVEKSFGLSAQQSKVLEMFSCSQVLSSRRSVVANGETCYIPNSGGIQAERYSREKLAAAAQETFSHTARQPLGIALKERSCDVLTFSQATISTATC